MVRNSGFSILPFSNLECVISLNRRILIFEFLISYNLYFGHFSPSFGSHDARIASFSTCKNCSKILLCRAYHLKLYTLFVILDTAVVAVVYLHCLIVLGVEDVGLRAVARILAEQFPYHGSQLVSAFAHVDRLGTYEEIRDAVDIYHDSVSFESSLATAGALSQLRFMMSPSGVRTLSDTTCH